MPKKGTTRISLPELQRMIEAAKREAEQLQGERADLEARIGKIDGRLAELMGAKKPGRPARPTKPKGKRPGRKKMTISQRVAKMLQASGKPLSVKEMGEALRKAGATKSKNADQLVYQAIKSGKASARKVGRGQYVAKDG